MTDQAGSRLAELRPGQLRRLARRADRARRRNPEAVTRLGQLYRITPRQLRLLADGWTEGGPSGVDALGPAPADADGEVMEAAAELVAAWRSRHFPLELLDVEVWRNQLTVHRTVAGDRPDAPPYRLPLFQLRVTPSGRWHLYRKAAQGEWWPVTVRGRGAPQDLADCLAAVRADDKHLFWRPPDGNG